MKNKIKKLLQQIEKNNNFQKDEIKNLKKENKQNQSQMSIM